MTAPDPAPAVPAAPDAPTSDVPAAAEPPAPRLRVGVVLPPPADDLGGWLTDGAAFEAAGADALWIDQGPELDPLLVAAALAATTYRSIMLVPMPEHVPDRARATLERLSRGRLRLVAGPATGAAVATREATVQEHDGLRWLAVPAPENRAAWRATVADAAEAGVDGLLVPADPRLLDLLRSPDEPGDRRDLHLAQG